MYRPLYYAARDNTCNIRRSLSITKALDFIKNGIVFFHMMCYSVNMVIIDYFMKNIRIILCYINKLYVREGD